ncbi:MAG: hypothetical protein E7381_02995 [Clostridiales bacterium]|nr:hypothetical protein [Clostridiales bacterium]
MQRQSLCASMAIAVVRRNKAFQQATKGCANQRGSVSCRPCRRAETQNKRSRELFPCRLQRQRLCASMAIAVVRRKQAFQQATKGCANQRASVLSDLVGERKPKLKGQGRATRKAKH